MSFLKKRSTRFYLGGFLLMMLALWCSAIPAFADSGGATATVNAGALSEAGTFGQSVSVTLNGLDQLVPYQLPVQVTDATGSGAGWNLQISGSPLADSKGHTLTQQVQLTAFVGCAPGSSCTPPFPPGGPPVVITGTPQRFFIASPTSGMGSMNLKSVVFVRVPGNAFAGIYMTTLTLAAASGP
jgi:hypothetical protein